MNEAVKEQLHFFSKLLGVPVALFLLAVLLFLAINLLVYRDTKIDGPYSTAGYQAVVHITDRGIGADHDVTVLIRRPEGGIIARYAAGDTGGDEFGEEVADSFLWTGADTVQFDTGVRERFHLRTDGLLTKVER